MTKSLSEAELTKRKEKAKQVIKKLEEYYPQPKIALLHNNPFQLLVATILSAQATDKLVNMVTPDLFKKYKTPEAIADANYEAFDKDISRINFHRNKAKNVQAAAKMLVEKYHGKVPETMEELTELPGVGRKTANVILGSAFGKPVGVVVDTHVKRLANRLGLTTESDPEKIEQDLIQIIPKDKWIAFSFMLILSGREYYPAGNRKPKEDGPLDGMFID